MRRGNFKFVHKAVELSAFDAEDSSGGDFPALAVFEGLGDDPALDLVERGKLVFGIRGRIGDYDFERQNGGLK